MKDERERDEDRGKRKEIKRRKSEMKWMMVRTGRLRRWRKER